MSKYIYACTDPKDKNIHVGQIEFMGGSERHVVIDAIRGDHPGSGDVILVDVTDRAVDVVDVAVDLDGICDKLNMRTYDITKRGYFGDVYVVDLTANRFIRAIGEMLADGTAEVIDITTKADDQDEPKGMIGYVDALNYYFLPNTLFDAVIRYDLEGLEYANWMGRVRTYKSLRDLGIVRQIGSDGKTTRMKRLPDGQVMRLLWIPRQYIDEMIKEG